MIVENSSNAIEASQRVEFGCCYIFYQNGKPELDVHRYKFEATVVYSNEIRNTGKLLTFSKFSSLCKSVVPDGAFLYSFDSDQINEIKIATLFEELGIQTRSCSFELSAESLLEDISLSLVDVLKSEFPDVVLKETKLRETANSYVTWVQEV